MARTFMLPEDDAGRQTGRVVGFSQLLSYVLRDAGPESWRGSFGLSMPIGHAAAEMAHDNKNALPNAPKTGPKATRPVLHAILGWHPSDLEWLTRDHLAITVEAALRAMGLNERQAVWVTHTDTGKPHVHIVANLLHPKTGRVARLGLTKKRMSDFCAAYEQALGDVRCKRRLIPKPANEDRSRIPRHRLTKAGRARVAHPDKQKASYSPAPRP